MSMIQDAQAATNGELGKSQLQAASSKRRRTRTGLVAVMNRSVVHANKTDSGQSGRAGGDDEQMCGARTGAVYWRLVAELLGYDVRRANRATPCRMVAEADALALEQSLSVVCKLFGGGCLAGGGGGCLVGGAALERMRVEREVLFWFIERI
ncbi:putative RNA-binding protein [Sesbania bispinosa]|nr:putative RNA-binding protein [Sesbania bispinosa]